MCVCVCLEASPCGERTRTRKDGHLFEAPLIGDWLSRSLALSLSLPRSRHAVASVVVVPLSVVVGVVDSRVEGVGVARTTCDWTLAKTDPASSPSVEDAEDVLVE